MSEIDNLAEAFAEDVREIVPLDDLLVLRLIHDKEKIETTFTTVDYADFIVAPLVVRVFIHRIVLLVYDINEGHLLQATLDEEGELDRVVCWQRHQISDALVC